MPETQAKIKISKTAARALGLLFFLFLSRAVFSPAAQAEARGYDDLLLALRAEQSAPQDRVAASWKMGKLMEDDADAHKLWADYSGDTNNRLAKDLGMSADEIRDMRQFARVYPEMPSPELGWSHYMVLVYVHPAEKREALYQQALREHWPTETLRLEVRKFREAEEQTVKPEHSFSKDPGPLNTYRVVKALSGAHEGKLVLDLGFGVQKRLDEAAGLTEGDFSNEKFQRVPQTENLFTYAATVTKIIDGDTFAASVDLGFGLSVSQTFRLNGVDAPEVASGEGVTAKTFVYHEITRAGGKVILRAGPPDKYNRILADVWVDDESLNEALLDRKLALPE